MRKHGFILFMDKTGLWCAAPPGFRDLIRDPMGRGRTKRDAVSQLLLCRQFMERAAMTGWRPTLSDFWVVRNALQRGSSKTDRRLCTRYVEQPHLYVV